MMLKKLAISVIALFPLLLILQGWAAAATAPDILIVELQVRSSAPTNAADQEFVELYNTTDQPIDVSSWKLQYKSATGSTWSDKVTLHGNLAAHSHYLLVSDKYPDPPVAAAGDPALAIDTFGAGLSDSAGHVRLVDAVVPAIPIVHDVLGWGSTANAAEGNAPAPAPAGGKSLKRKVDGDGNFIDTNNNAADFEVSPTPSPQADPLYVAPVADLPASEPDPDPAPDPAAVNDPDSSSSPDPEPPAETTDPADVAAQTPAPTAVLLPPQITELLPNPAPPASDSTDEFIELYNPNDQPLDLSGYKLQSGLTYSYSYIFKETSLAAHQYKAFLVTETGDILSNSGGQARLLDTNGGVVAQTNPYDAADDGKAWALVSGSTNDWQWTTTPTPNQPNVFTSEPAKTVGVVKATAKTNKTTKTAAKPKTTTASKTAKTTKSATPDRQVYEDPAATTPAIHPVVLVGVGLMALVYAAWEYRHDAINFFHRFQRYRAIRRAARSQTTGQ